MIVRCKLRVLSANREMTLIFGVCVLKDDELIRKILHEAHSSCLSVYLGSTKMYNDLKKLYWWSGMKRDISEFIIKCLICQQVKAEHQVPSRLL
ncbi:reverse transcriptase [Gossypium australe]|uniref:Reverse transcriptase n=1 Tax=Gossypium australe TaxID=47621 RepID=A0A5B6WS85_9ROSI|nr:reverse transcriptase [Gossypium australe]